MADNETFDPWATSSGLIDDVDAYIDDAYFKTDAQYNDGGTLLLALDLSTDDPDYEDGATQLYSCGNGWEAKDKGAKAVREDGKTKNFSKQSAYGSLFTEALKLEGVAEELKRRGTPFEAEIWKGLGFHFKRQPFSFKGGDGETTSTERLLPTAYLGVKDGASGKASAAKVPDVAPTKAGSDVEAVDAPPADDAGAGSNGAVSPATVARLKLVAKKHDSHDGFIEAAFALGDVVIDDEAVQALVMDEDWYTGARG